ncbi:MAG TPA: DUF4342 domain-containing protein [Chloroflexota bacterium]|nr:DUF4342 domain-containing protein [Chloroflexota bacterium]
MSERSTRFDKMAKESSDPEGLRDEAYVPQDVEEPRELSATSAEDSPTPTVSSMSSEMGGTGKPEGPTPDIPGSEGTEWQGRNEEIPVHTTESGGSTTGQKGRTWTEQIEMAGGEVVNRIGQIVAQGNVRRLIFRRSDGRVLLEVPLTAGVAVTGVAVLAAPVLAALSAMAALVAQVKVEIVRSSEE